MIETTRSALGLGAPRWRGQRGRIEVWYATWTGGWIHYEMVAPTDPSIAPYGHGWFVRFPEHEPAVTERFGPAPLETIPGTWFAAGGASIGPGSMRGPSWHLAFTEAGGDTSTGNVVPLFTFPRAAWERDLLPGAQIVPWPRTRITGVAGGEAVDQTGAVARIYAHGNAHRWCWLHADLGDGDVVEVVAAVARLRPLRGLPPVTMAVFNNRRLLASRARIDDDTFHIRGRNVDIRVGLPALSRVALTYTDPDGATATCTNSERANAEITIGQRHWNLTATAHAEIGTRP